MTTIQVKPHAGKDVSGVEENFLECCELERFAQFHVVRGGENKVDLNNIRILEFFADDMCAIRIKCCLHLFRGMFAKGSSHGCQFRGQPGKAYNMQAKRCTRGARTWGAGHTATHSLVSARTSSRFLRITNVVFCVVAYSPAHVLDARHSDLNMHDVAMRTCLRGCDSLMFTTGAVLCVYINGWLASIARKNKQGGVHEMNFVRQVKEV